MEIAQQMFALLTLTAVQHDTVHRAVFADTKNQMDKNVLDQQNALLVIVIQQQAHADLNLLKPVQPTLNVQVISVTQPLPPALLLKKQTAEPAHEQQNAQAIPAPQEPVKSALLPVQKMGIVVLPAAELPTAIKEPAHHERQSVKTAQQIISVLEKTAVSMEDAML